MMVEIIFNGDSERYKTEVLDAPIFTRWRDKIVENFDVAMIIVHQVFHFGSRIGFIVAEAAARFDGQNVPGIVFLRGDSVSIMPVFTVEGKDVEYTAIVTEPRIPIGRNNQSSLPAGMIDGDKVNVAAIKELSEEIGSEINITSDDLINLGSFPLSCGGCDEIMTLFAFRYNLSRELFDVLDDRKTGCGSENENIHVSLIPLDDIPKLHMVDARSCLSYYLWKSKN